MNVLVDTMQTITFKADFSILDSVRDLVGEAAQQAGLDGKAVYAVQLAADEACSNVIEHAYAGVTDADFELGVEAQPGQVIIVVHDHGKQFDITKVRKPNLSKNLDEREVGGLGVYLIHKLMDEVRFESSKKNGNFLTMVKRSSGGA